MDKRFFKLPDEEKRKIWAALMTKWANKKATNRTTG